ncbi:MAG TPA: hypothetical protein VGG04_00930 [Candidatus Sulfotelmatobacter sp.]|jgi:hypothetical protein
MAAPVNNSAWVEWMTTLMGGVSRQTTAAAFPPDRFYCLLDELPVHLIPQRFRRRLRQEAERTLYLNPECRFHAPGQAPEVIPEALLSRFALIGTTAWVREPEGGSWLPFWLGPRYEALVRDLRPGEEVLSSTPAGARRVLAAAGIFIGGQHDSQAASHGAAQFREKGYAPIGNLIHPFHVAALRRYYRYLIRAGEIRLGDNQSGRRYVAHNDPVARFFHHQIASRLSAIAGLPLKPSYVYIASYLSGAELKKHTDREQCEYSVTFCLDFSPEPPLATPWPIQLDTPGGRVTVYQALGDGLAYRGTRLPHYRSPLGEGQTSTSIFFHYVAEDFSGPLE